METSTRLNFGTKKMEIKNSVFELIDLQNFVSYLYRCSTSPTIVIDKVKVLTNALLKKGVFSFLHSLPIDNEHLTGVKSGSMRLDGYNFTSVQLKKNSNYIRTISGRLYSTARSNSNTPGLVKSFLLTVEETLKTKKRTLEARIVTSLGRETIIKYAW